MESDYGWVDAVKGNASTLRAFRAGVISLHELFDNILDMTFHADERTWKASILVIPELLRPRFLDFVRSYLVSVDFMPPPGVILPPPKSQAEVQAVKKERRPRYMRLLRLIEEVCMASECGTAQ